jgi:hypothetical protein
MISIRLLPDHHHHHISLPRNTIDPSIIIVACSIIIICVLPFAASFQFRLLSLSSIANHFTPLSLHHRRHHRILPTSIIGDGAAITTNSNHIRVNKSRYNNNININNNINMSSNHDDNVAAGTTTTAPPSSSSSFRNISSSNNIPTFDRDDKAKATDFANYFCAYAQLYHQKQMLTDHNRMVSF